MSENGPENTPETPAEHPQEHRDMPAQLEEIRAQGRADAERRQKERLAALDEVSGEHKVVKPEDRYGQ